MLYDTVEFTITSYDRDFLLQFMAVCKTKPPALLFTASSGLEEIDPGQYHPAQRKRKRRLGSCTSPTAGGFALHLRKATGVSCPTISKYPLAMLSRVADAAPQAEGSGNPSDQRGTDPSAPKRRVKSKRPLRKD